MRRVLFLFPALTLLSICFSQGQNPAVGGQGQTSPAGIQLQNSPPGQEQTPVFRANARDVVVDVVVTDAKGAPLSGLKPSDFEVFEDKKPQKIDFFEEHAAKTLPPADLAPLPEMPPDVYTNVPPAPESDAVNVLLLDTLNTPPQDFSYARNQVIQFLHNVAPGTRMAIVTLSDKLTFVQGFTTDASALLAAIQDKKKGANPQISSAVVSRTEQAEIASTIGMRSSSMGGQSTMGVAALNDAFTMYQDYTYRNQMMMTLEALQDLARYLANVPGRKNLIWFSSRFPVFIFPNLSERGTLQDIDSPFSQVRKTADALTAARVAVYPVNARGVMEDTVYSADSGGLGNTPGVGRMGGPMGTFMAEASQRAQVMGEMEQLAADTGGTAIFNNNDLSAATARAISDGSHYYTLTYSPTNKKLDNHFRNILLKASNGTWKLAYRRGYNADDLGNIAPAAPPNPLQPLMRLGMPQSTEILYGLRVVPVPKQPAPGAPRAGKNEKLTGPATRYSVDFMIRWSDLKITPMAEDKEWGRIEVQLLAYDPNGTALNWIGGTMEMQLNPATYASIQRSGVPAHLEIDVPQGKEFYLSSGVYDWRTGKAGTLQVPVHAAEISAAAPPAPGPPKVSGSESPAKQ